MLAALPLADVITTDQERLPCAWPDCMRGAEANGLCDSHYHRMRRMGALDCNSRMERVAMEWLAFANADSDDDAAADETWARVVAAMEDWRRARNAIEEGARKGSAVAARNRLAGGRR